jgi:hypothetical protein
MSLDLREQRQLQGAGARWPASILHFPCHRSRTTRVAETRRSFRSCCILILPSLARSAASKLLRVLQRSPAGAASFAVTVTIVSLCCPATGVARRASHMPRHGAMTSGRSLPGVPLTPTVPRRVMSTAATGRQSASVMRECAPRVTERICEVTFSSESTATRPLASYKVDGFGSRWESMGLWDSSRCLRPVRAGMGGDRGLVTGAPPPPPRAQIADADG